MSELSVIKPINTKILFQFVEDLGNASFNKVSAGGIALIEDQANQVGQHRWAKVLAKGGEIDDETLKVGEFILIEALGWTEGLTLTSDLSAEKFWFTQLDKVMCVSEDLPEGII